MLSTNRWTGPSRHSFISCWRGRGRCTWSWQPSTSSSSPPPPPCFQSSAITSSRHNKPTTQSPLGSPHAASGVAAEIIDSEAIEKRLRELGVKENTLLFTLRNPQHACSIQWTTVKLVLDEGFTARQITVLLNRQLFLTPYQKLVALLDFLTTLHITGQKAGRVLATEYKFTRCRVETLQRNLKLLESFGLEPEQIRRTISFAPRILLTSNDTLRRRVAWLQDLGVHRKGTLRILRTYPILLCQDLEKRLLPKIALLESMGLNRVSILKAISSRPMFFMLSLATFVGKVEFIQKLGFEKDSHYFFPVLYNLGCLSCERVLMRYNMLMARGLSPDEVRRIVEISPTVFGFSEAQLSKKIDHLIEIMNLDIKEIVRFPVVLCHSLEKRIIPRFELLTDAIEKGKLGTVANGLLGSGLSLSTAIGLTDKRFHEWLLKREGRGKLKEERPQKRTEGGKGPT